MTCMSEGRSIYRLYDPDPSKGCHLVKDWTEADEWALKKWGIFWTVNEFNGPRKKENCVKVLSWVVDLDDGSKEAQASRIRDIRLTPSAIIETKRGHHVYFDAIDGDPENYREIVERMVEVYGGDKNAKDLCRILRVPAYPHWKDPNDPFAVKLIFSSGAAYTEAEITKVFPAPEPVEEAFQQKTALRRELKFQPDQGLWERIWNLDCEEALKRLSGSAAVGCDMFSFKRTTNGNLNILSNGKGTSCWIDQTKRIGSLDKGGPSIFQWINWYQHNNKRTLEIIKEYFPEVSK
jgi:hypothetical protein